MKNKESNFVTEVRLNEIIETDGPAKFTILEMFSSGHKNRSIVSVAACRSVKIKKLAADARNTANKWGLCED